MSAELGTARASGVKTGRKLTHRWSQLVLLSAAEFLVLLDATVVNIALPSIQHGLHFSNAELQWVISGYVLAFGSFLLPWGRAGDLMGHARIFMAGTAAFGLASLVCGLANSATVLVVFRIGQGLSAAMISPSALALVRLLFADDDSRTRALAVWGAVGAVGAAAGLLLGGLVTTALSWRWIFLINVPVAVAVVATSWRALPRNRERTRRQPIDLAGAVLVSAGLIAVIFALSEVPRSGWEGGSTVAGAVTGLTLIGGFIRYEHRHKAPLLPLGFLRPRKATLAMLGLLLTAAGLFGVFYFSSLYVQDVLHYSPMGAGVAFLPVTAAIAGGSYVADPLRRRIGARSVALFGLMVSLAGLLWLARLPTTGSYAATLLPGLMCVYIGMGLSFVPLTLMSTAVEEHEAGLASGLLNSAQQVGGAIGLALVVSIAAEHTSSLANHGVGAKQALVEGFQRGFIAGAVLIAASVATVAATFALRD